MTRQGNPYLSVIDPLSQENTKAPTAFSSIFVRESPRVKSPSIDSHPSSTPCSTEAKLLLLDGLSDQALGVLDVDGLDVAVQLLLGALLIVPSAGDTDAESVWDTLDTLLPHLLVQLGVQADVGGALFVVVSSSSTLSILHPRRSPSPRKFQCSIACVGERVPVAREENDARWGSVVVKCVP